MANLISQRGQLLLLYLALTAAIATGLALFFSASTILDMARAATTGLVLPILLAMITAFLLAPLVRFFECRRLERNLAILLVYSLVSLALYSLTQWFLPYWQEVWTSLQADLPRYTAGLIRFLREGQADLIARFPVLASYDVPQRVKQMGEHLVSSLLAQTPRGAIRVGSLLVMVPLFSFFFIRDGRQILRFLISLAPNRYFEMVHDLTFLISRQTTRFVRGRIIEAAIVGGVVSAGLAVTDIRYAPLLGAFAGIANLIPYVGPVVGIVPGLFIALVDLGMGPQFWWIVTVYVLIAQILLDNFILIPILISRVSNLHPLVVLLAIIMGGQLFGVLGMIIGVPVASALKIALLEVRHYRRAFSLPETSFEPERPD